MEDSTEQPVGECIPDGGAWQLQGYDETERKDLLVHTKCCAVLEKSRARDDKISTWDLMVVS